MTANERTGPATNGTGSNAQDSDTHTLAQVRYWLLVLACAVALLVAVWVAGVIA